MKVRVGIVEKPLSSGSKEESSGEGRRVWAVVEVVDVYLLSLSFKATWAAQ